MSELVPRLDAAFEGWIQAQQAAIETVRTADVARSPVDDAEGYRWVTRLTSLAWEWFLEKSDPLHPEVFLLQDAHRKLLVDNPDVGYWFCVLDDRHLYHLTGTRGEAPYVGLTFGTPLGQGSAGGRTGTTTQAHLDQFDLGPDGQVDLWMGPADLLPDPRPANSIVIEPGTGQLAVRETFFDKRTQEGCRLRVELVGEADPPALDVEDFAAQLEVASLFVQFVAATAVTMWHDTDGNVNRFGGTSGKAHVEAQQDETRTHSSEDQTYHGGRFELAEGQALVVTVRRPERGFLYWGLTLTSPWMESYDYRYAQTNLNNHRAEPDAGGDWELVIAPSDPGVANWLDTGGRRTGYMLVRWVLAEDPPVPVARLVDLADLRAGSA